MTVEVRHAAVEVGQIGVELRHADARIGTISIAVRHPTATPIRHGVAVQQHLEGTASWSFALSPGQIGRRTDVAPQIAVRGDGVLREELADQADQRWRELQRLPTVEQAPIDVATLRSSWFSAR